MLLAAVHTASAGDAAAGIFAGLFGLIFLVILFAVGAALYFLPTIVAVMRKRPNVAIIGVINVFLGWSLVGWIVSIVMALSNDQPVQHITIVNQQGQSPVAYVPNTPTAPAEPPYSQTAGTLESEALPETNPPAVH